MAPGSAARVARRTPLGSAARGMHPPPSAGRPCHPGTPGSVGLAARRASALAAAAAAAPALPPSTGGNALALRAPRASAVGLPPARTPTGGLAAPPITFQDFLGAVDLQFLDHMRRGTSISLADLADDPPPASLRDAYSLLTVTAPAVAALEGGVATLRDEVAARKATIVDKEAALARANPPLFAAVQTAAGADLDRVRSSVALLKRVCRARTAVCWKEWRAKQETDRSAALASAVGALRRDAAAADALATRARAASAAARAWAARELSVAWEAGAARAAAAGAARAAADAAAALTDARAANAARRARAAAADAAAEAARARADAAAAARADAATALAAARADAQAGAAAADAAAADEAAATAASRADALTLLRGVLGVTLERVDARAGVLETAFGRAGALRLTLNARAGGGGVRASLAPGAADALPHWAAHLARSLVAGAAAPYAPAPSRGAAAGAAWAAAAGRVRAAASVVDAAVDAAATLPTVARCEPDAGGRGVLLTLVSPRAGALLDVVVPLGAALDGGPRAASAAARATRPRATARARAAPVGTGKALADAVAAVVDAAVAATAGGGAALAAAAVAADAALRAAPPAAEGRVLGESNGVRREVQA